MADPVIMTLVCDGIPGPYYCRKSAEFSGADITKATDAARAAGWTFDYNTIGPAAAYCPSCSKPIPAWTDLFQGE